MNSASWGQNFFTHSLRNRMIALITLILLVLNIISTLLIIHHTDDEIAEIFNAQQAQLARTIDQVILDLSFNADLENSVSQVPNFEEDDEDNLLGHYYEQKIAYQIWDSSGNLILRSENAPLQPFGLAQSGFQTTQLENGLWHVFGLFAKGSNHWIYTAQDAQARDELVDYIVRDYLLNLCLINVFVILAAVLCVVYGLKPIQTFARALALRDADNLQPIQVALIQELLPIQYRVNQLLGRIENSLAQEKAFNADVSHELRTPLSAIKVHAQSLALNKGLSLESQASVGFIAQSIDGMTLIIEQLLLLDRIESQALELNPTPVDLLQLAQEVLLGLPAHFHDTHNFSLEGDSVVVKGQAALLSALVRNLVENAVKYSPVNAAVVICVGRLNQQPMLQVVDEGPGMTSEQKINVLKRRYRISDQQAYGSGLGLSIVQKILSVHGAELEFLDRADGPGLRVQVLFPVI